MSRHRTPEQLANHREAERSARRWAHLTEEQRLRRNEMARVREQRTRKERGPQRYFKTPIPVLDRDTCLYLAGLFDGEGSFMLRAYQHRGGLKMSGCIRLAMTHRPTIEWICKKLDRPVQSHGYGNKIKNAKKCYRVSVENVAGMISLIEQLLPYLITKKEAAGVLLQFCYSRRNSKGATDNRVGYGRYTGEEYELCTRLHALNKVGAESEVVH